MPRHEARPSRTQRSPGFVDPYAEFGLDADCLVAGVDEAGRGALAGPVTAAAVILGHGEWISGLADSKTMTPKRRSLVEAAIRERAAAFAVAHVEPAIIDTLGIAEATRRAMLEAIAGLAIRPHLVLVDGLPVELGIESRTIVRGDSLVPAIAAASVVAKVSRDALMAEADAAFPGYGFAVHKGYGTPDHLAAIERHGPCAIHRRSFAPCCRSRLF